MPSDIRAGILNIACYGEITEEDEDGVKDDEYVIIKYISDLLDMDESFTHWRPINLK